ncbi:MAG: hypothetical protein ACYDEJ_06465 [Desulfitobacteriaceae bacterium]
MDYKTDYVAPGRVDKIRERYRVQIRGLAAAVQGGTERHEYTAVYCLAGGENPIVWIKAK